MGNEDMQNSEKEKATDLASLKLQRATMKRTISKLKAKVEKEGTSSDYTIIKCRLQMLESYFNQISHMQTQIERFDSTDETRTDLEELFIQTKAFMVDLLTKKRRSSDIDLSMLNATSSTFTHQNRLPQLKLPKFDGKYAEYSRFISTFKTLVHEEPCIPTIDKFNYLLNCLSGPALAVVEAFQITEENYQKAIDKLKERYHNKTLIFLDHINSLFAISHFHKPNAPALRSILDSVSALRSSLLSLGSETDVLNAMLIHIVLSKVDSASKTVYEEKQDLNQLPSWEEFYSILSRRCQFLETRTTEGESYQNNDSKSLQKIKRSGSSFVTSSIPCEYCHNKEHSISNCSSYLSLPVPRRFDFIKSANLCINCLRKGHIVSKCQSKSRCCSCRISHHTSLHNPSFKSANEPQNSSHSSSQSQLSSNASSFKPSSASFMLQNKAPENPLSFKPSSSYQTLPSNSANNSAAIHCTTRSTLTKQNCRRTLLPTAIVLIKDHFGILRALLDSCSEINLITQETVNRLRLKQNKASQEISGVSTIRTQLKYKVFATIKSRLSDFEFSSNFAVTKSISSYQPSERFEINKWNIPKDLQLADPNFYSPNHVELLIGAEIFFDLLKDGKISLGYGRPCLINTALGWTVGGKIEAQMPNQVLSCNVTTHYEELDSILKTFWEEEEFAQTKNRFNEEENRCEMHFIENTVFDESGRVKVRLPFKGSTKTLGRSFEVARRRFMFLEKRLLKDKNLRKLYVDFMNEYIGLGHMSLVNYDVLDQQHYVIPHHCVLRPQNTSTKLRVVFDASARTSTNVSLNDILMVGPTIQENLIITTLAFRLNKYALTADVCKMYRQFVVDENDRNYQLILWREDINDPIRVYRLNTVTYGTSAAPFLAVRSLFFIADAYKTEFPTGSSVLKQDMYVDDLLTGATTIFELSKKKAETVELLKKAGLQLSKWSSNYLPLAHSTETLELKSTNESITKTLGMLWKPKQDSLCFRFDSTIIAVPTKRLVLSVVARIFDILGLLSPIVISCKVLIQELWKNQFDWDSPLNDTLNNRWKQIEETLHHINFIEVPRFVRTFPDEEFDIHGFADASQLAYGCCIYIRRFQNDCASSHLLIAKSKVAPVLQQSLPRLELCAL